jgi:hypothetical protein
MKPLLKAESNIKVVQREEWGAVEKSKKPTKISKPFMKSKS